MNHKYRMYCSQNFSGIERTISNEFEELFFSPSLTKLSLQKSDRLLYFIWYIFTFGRYKIFYIKNKETQEIVHVSHILPKYFKFQFMGKKDLHIVACFTHPNYRGKSLYPYALYKILNKYTQKKIWIITSIDNPSSIRGIEKAGFKFEGIGKKYGILGIYRFEAK